MELVTADIVQARQGEAAFILQLRPPVIDNAEELAQALEAFTHRYLGTAPGDEVRFASLGALTWALSAPSYQIEAVDQACDGLAEALFGDPGSAAVHLVRQPDMSVPEPEAADTKEEDWTPSGPSAADEEAEAGESEGWDAIDQPGSESDMDVSEDRDELSEDLADPALIETDPLAEDTAEAEESDWDVATPSLDIPDEEDFDGTPEASADLTVDEDLVPDLDTPQAETDQDDEWALADPTDEAIDLDEMTALKEPVHPEAEQEDDPAGDVSAFDDLDADEAVSSEPDPEPEFQTQPEEADFEGVEAEADAVETRPEPLTWRLKWRLSGRKWLRLLNQFQPQVEMPDCRNSGLSWKI